MTLEPTPTPAPGTPENVPPIVPQPEPATPNPTPAPQPKPEETVEYWKDRYGHSTAEAQLLIEQNKLKDQRISELTKPHDPTDAELLAAYPNWDEMMPTEKQLARENFSLKREVRSTQLTTAEIQADVRWGKDLKKLAKTEEFKTHAEKLKSDEFEDYVFKPNHKGIALDVLARSFLFGATPAAPVPTPPVNLPATGERGSGGQPPAPNKKLSADEAKLLRETNYEEYRRQVEADNIDFTL